LQRLLSNRRLHFSINTASRYHTCMPFALISTSLLLFCRRNSHPVSTRAVFRAAGVLTARGHLKSCSNAPARRGTGKVCMFPGCEMRCKYADRLHRHEEGHTEKKRYACDTCKKSFSRSYHLKAQKKFHSRKVSFIEDRRNRMQ
jgi:uncharacterized Zn-finger protein